VKSVIGQFWVGATFALCSVLALSNEEAKSPAPAGIIELPENTKTGEFGTPELIFQQQDDPVLVAPDTAAYQFYITDLESRFGPYAAGLSEQLLGLGVAYQDQELHDAAIVVFKRGVHLARINSGLYGQDQIPLLQAMIGSLIAKGDYDRANEREIYLYRVQRKVYGPNSQRMTDAMLQRAAREQRVFHQTDGDLSFLHLLTMGELYGSVLHNISLADGSTSTRLIDPLMGLLETQYIIARYGDIPGRASAMGGSADTSYIQENRFAMVRASNYKKGQAVIAALRDVYDYNEDEQSPLSAKTWVMLGDWHLYHQKRDSALTAYQKAWDEFAVLENSSEYQAQFLSQSELLPDFPGFARDLVPPDVVKGYAEVSYTISPHGRVKHLKVLKLEPFDEENQRQPVRLLRRLKRSLHRPLLVERVPTATETNYKRYAY
jgi:tetratricopeptide (TPR) repeat protein